MNSPMGRIPAAAALSVLLAAPLPAAAHPHVWVEVQTTVEAERGAFTGVRQRWTFDEYYSSMAIEGLETDKTGAISPAALAELAKVNMEGLKEFGYFTVARLGSQTLSFVEPTDYALTQATSETPPPGSQNDPSAQPPAGQPSSGDASKNAAGAGGNFWGRAWDSLLGKGEPPTLDPQKPKVLVLEFLLKLEQPVLAEAEGLRVATADPTFFIWFELAKKDPARLSGAPAGCVAEVQEAGAEGSDTQRSGETFFNTVGGAGSGSSGKTIAVKCPKN